MRLVPAVLLTSVGLAFATGSTAQNSSDLTLDWQAMPSCSSTAQLRDDIARDLRGSPSGARNVRARARASQSADGAWHVDLVTEAEGESHQRSFDAESCSAAETALALILAFAINPQATADAPESQAPTPAAVESDATLDRRAAAPKPSPAVVSAPRKRAPSTPAPRSSAAHLAGVSAALAFDLGTLPHLTEGVQLALGFYPGHWRFELAGTDWLKREGTAQRSAASAEFHLLTGAARAGYIWPVGRLAVGSVLAADFAQLNSAGSHGSLANYQGSYYSGGVSAGGLLAWSFGARTELHFLLEGLHWFERPNFVVQEPKPPDLPVYQASGVVGRAELGASVRFF